jgi:hypothetical protein
MSDALVKEPEIIPTRELNRVRDTMFNHWRHVVPVDKPWTIALQREYWHTVGSKLRAGDRIDVTSADFRVQFTILVLGANVNVDPPWLDFAYLPVYPADLQLPQPAPQLPPRFVVRASGATGTFDIVNAKTGEVVRPSLYRHQAEQIAADLDKAGREGEAAMAVAAVAHYGSKPATPEPPPVKSKSAERAARYRERQRALKEEGAAA